MRKETGERITRFLVYFDRNRFQIYLGFVAIFIGLLILSLVVYTSSNGEYSLVGAVFAILMSISIILLIVIDMLIEALELAHTPARLEEKLLGQFKNLKFAGDPKEMNTDYKRNRAREYWAELEYEWLSTRTFTPIGRLLEYLGKVTLIVGFLLVSTLCLTYLNGYNGFFGVGTQPEFWEVARETNQDVDTNGDIIKIIYISAKAILDAETEHFPSNLMARMLLVFEQILALIVVGAGFERIITPVEEEMKMWRKAMRMYFNVEF